MSSAQNDAWLEQFASKIRTLCTLSNHEEVVKRLSQPAEYLGARFEMDTALAFLLGGFNVGFVKRNATPTVDLEVRKDSSEYAVEVTSLNDSGEFERIDRISAYAWFQVFKQKENLVSGGIVIKAPKSEDALKGILERIDSAISAAVETGYARLNLPGTATLYFAKQEFADKIPKDSRQQFRYGKIRSPDIEDKIIAKINDKWDQLGQQSRPGILLVSTGFMGPDEMNTLFSNPLDNVAVALSVYPGICTLGVSCPVPMLGLPLRYAAVGDKISFCAGVGRPENRNFYFWKNTHADVEASPLVFEAIRNYGSNLKSMPPMQ